MDGLSWKDYITGHPERLPRASGTTWADVPRPEARRVTRNWRRWRARRLAALREPAEWQLVGDRVVVVGRRRRLGLA